MNKNKINLMIEEKIKEKNRVEKKMLLSQKQIRHAKILNKINPFNCSFILTTIISFLIPFKFFLSPISSITTFLIIGILSYVIQNNSLKKIYSHKDTHIKKQLNSLMSYNKEVCEGKIIDSELELLKQKYDNGMPKFNIEHYSSFTNNTLDIQKYEDTINKSIDNIHEASKKKSILEINKEYSLKNIIKNILISNPLIVLFTIICSFYNILSIPPMLTYLLGGTLFSINIINQITNYNNAKKTICEYDDLLKTKDISEDITELNNEIERNINNIYINKQYEFDIELINGILEIENKGNNSVYKNEQNNNLTIYSSMPKLKIYKK